MTARKQIGTFSSEVIQLLKLNISPGTPIYIGESNIEHIKKRHPYEYENYFCDIEDILKNPDYVGQNPHDLSILFVRLYKMNGEYIRVAVKITSHGNFYTKTLHLLSSCNAERYIERGTLKKLDKPEKNFIIEHINT